MENIVLENLHPELHAVATSKAGRYSTSKQTQIARKIKDLTSRGEETGIEGNMPKGSSRAYLPIKDKLPVTIDGKKAEMKSGLKVAIRASLDKHHDEKEHDGMGLGALQNEAENGDHYVNNQHRILTQDSRNPGHYETNEEGGIFPPLVDHDHDNHQWSHVGHVGNVGGKRFRELTKTESHPEGISHSDFCSALERDWNRAHGKHWHRGDDKEAEADHIESHPLVQKFLDHQRNMDAPPHDYRQLKNLGLWTHPVTGNQHIVARDHGFSKNVMDAYSAARKKMRR
jgi:hypothetical protein